MLKKWLLKLTLKKLTKKVNNAKKKVEKSKDEIAKEKNLKRIRKAYVDTINELSEFFELERNPEDLSLEELDKTLDFMMEELQREYNIKV